MSDINTCIFTGNVVRDPEVKVARSGTEYVTFSIGNTTRFYDVVAGRFDDDSQFIDFIAFGECADKVKKTVRRGHKVYIESELQQTKYRDSAGKIRRWYIHRVRNIELRDGEKGQRWHSSNWI